MKLYIKDNNIYWLDEPLADADAEQEVSDVQEEILRNGGTAEWRDGVIRIIPKAAETVEITSSNITKREFLTRLTPEEFAAIKAATTQNSTVDYFWQLFMVAEEIDLSHHDTVAGIHMLEAAGLLATGRATEILS